MFRAQCAKSSSATSACRNSQCVCFQRKVRQVFEFEKFSNPNDRPHIAAFILPSYSGSVFCKSLPSPSVLHSSKTHTIPRHAARFRQVVEIRYAVHSSALIDGVVGLHVGSIRTVAAHVAIGVTGQYHRHSSVVRRCRPQARYRASRLPGLYHLSSAWADLLSAFGVRPARVFAAQLMTARGSTAAPWRHSTRRCRAARPMDRRRSSYRRATSRA